jgi:hypothetical protein
LVPASRGDAPPAAKDYAMAKFATADLLKLLSPPQSWPLAARRRPQSRTPGEPTWIDEKRFQINDITFFTTSDPSEYHNIKSTDKNFLLIKDKSMVERLLAVSHSAPVRNILDIGIWQGGSVVFYHMAFQPDKLVAIEYASTPVAPLEKYVSKSAGADSVRTFYGVNQGDARRMNEILASEFRTEHIDLVVDDASHQYEETRVSFNAAFGKYVLD